MKHVAKLSETLLNSTMGGFEIPFFSFFKITHGEYEPLLDGVKQIAKIFEEQGNVRIRYAVAKQGVQWGTWSEKGYINGVLGMLESGQADVIFFPAPIDAKDLPGTVAALPITEEYYIYSFVQRKLTVTENILSCLTIINPECWLLLNILMFLLFLLPKLMIKRSSLWILLVRSIVDTLQNIIGQPEPTKRLPRSFRALQLLLGLLFMACFNAAFNTNAIIEEREGNIDTLADIIKYDKTPAFVEGESMYELFRGGHTHIFDQVYQLAKGKQSHIPMSIDLTGLLNRLDDGNVILGSKKGFDILLPIFNSVAKSLGRGGIKIYKSKWPYHTTLLGDLVAKKSDTFGLEIMRRYIKLYSRISEIGVPLKLRKLLPGDLGKVFLLNNHEPLNNPAILYESNGGTQTEVQPLRIHSIHHILTWMAALYCIIALIFMGHYLKARVVMKRA